MPAYGYEFYLLVVNSISHSFAASWPLEDKIHIHARACNILYISSRGKFAGLILTNKESPRDRRKEGLGFMQIVTSRQSWVLTTWWDFSARIFCNSVFSIRFILLPSNRIFILTSNKQTGVKWRKSITSGHCVTNTIEQLPSTLQLNRHRLCGFVAVRVEIIQS